MADSLHLQPSPDPPSHPLPQLPPMAVATVLSPHPTLLDDPPMAVPLLLPAPSRRLPPPCWTPDETSSLIDAYRLKWYSLRRGNLRAAHWQDVADLIHSLCPDVSPPKTAVQCRHKMEKLRKRYRSELLRANSIPHHRFSSSWVYFSKMDSMEKNVSSSSPSLPSPQPLSFAPVPNGFPHFDDHVAAEDDDHEHDEGSTPHTYLQPRTGFGTANYQPRHAQRIRISGNNYSNRTSGNYADFDDSPVPNPSYGFEGSRAHKSGHSNNNFGSPPYNGDRFVDDYEDSKNGMGMERNNYMNANSMGGAGAGAGGVSDKKKRKMVNGGGEKREKGKEAAGMEMVEAIRMLGEGFVRMEKMKMEMMRETERVRMEMEMKRTQMLLESQQRIVEAFAKGWGDVMNNKKNDHDDDDGAS